MKWVEVIQLRAFDSPCYELALREARELPMARSSDLPESISLWTNPDLPTDLSLLLHWDSDQESREKTWIGLQMSQVFSQFGWVIHSLWKNENLLTKQGAKHGA
ncbi:MAG: hypothetical protein KKA60_05105 [Proteobacteria bacterium]|nr:hypothetical protein [Pseudomonadota bacterium]